MSDSAENARTAGWWEPGETAPETGASAVRRAILDVNRPVILIRRNGDLAVGKGGRVVLGEAPSGGAHLYPVCAYVPPLHPGNLGDPTFRKRYHLQYAYVAGAMANGITSVEMVEAAGRAGMIGFFGAAGLSPEEIESAVDRLQQRLEGRPFGSNLIHSPAEPEHEAGVVDLYLRKGVRLVSASAYLGLTLPLVEYRVKGIYRDDDGNIICPNKVIAKVSRIEVAEKFFAPPPDKLLKKLLNAGKITAEEAELAKSIPMAEDLTAEADSGGHTDNRPAIALLPTMIAGRDRAMAQYGYQNLICIGLGGGISTPESAAAAFAMGAAYVLTGSVNQACVEAGTSREVCVMLSEAGQADITMAPAADMFEMGVKVQVLKRGTMFALRAAKLYELYTGHDRYEDIPEKQRETLERDLLRCGFQDAWNQTRSFFMKRDPKQVERADRDPKHKMALVFRSYLGQSSRWATIGDPTRKIDYQVWCGPSLGAFNEWVRGSFLEKPENRRTVTVAMNLLYGAALVTRVNWIRYQGVVLDPEAVRFSPMELSDINTALEAQTG